MQHGLPAHPHEVAWRLARGPRGFLRRLARSLARMQTTANSTIRGGAGGIGGVTGFGPAYSSFSALQRAAFLAAAGGKGRGAVALAVLGPLVSAAATAAPLQEGEGSPPESSASGNAAASQADASSSSSTSTSSSSSSSGGKRRGVFEFGNRRRRATDVLLVINCACFVLQWLSKGMLTFWGAKVNELILQGQVWRLLTSAFLHSSIVHLAVNSYSLHNLGPQVELLSGSRRFLAVYLGSAVTGAVASLAFTPSPSVGASGSIFGLGAALGLFYGRHGDILGSQSEKMLRQLGVALALNLAFSLAVKNIDNWGHLGGILGGAALAWALGPRLVERKAAALATSGEADGAGPMRDIDKERGGGKGLKEGSSPSP